MKIALIGSGHLAKELAKTWSQQHFITIASTGKEKIKEPFEYAQKCMHFKGSDIKEMTILVSDNDIVVSTLVADYEKEYEEVYLNTAIAIKEAALIVDQPKYLIYASTSYVYGDHQGKWVDETASLNIVNDKMKILIDTENILLSLQDLGWKVCLFRLAYIYGFIKDYSDLTSLVRDNVISGNGSYYTNMVHLNDVIGATEYALSHKLTGIYNLVDDAHPTRQATSDIVCKRLKIPKIKWDATNLDFPDANKRLSNHKLKAAGYVFKYPTRPF